MPKPPAIRSTVVNSQRIRCASSASLLGVAVPARAKAVAIAAAPRTPLAPPNRSNLTTRAGSPQSRHSVRGRRRRAHRRHGRGPSRAADCRLRSRTRVPAAIVWQRRGDTSLDGRLRSARRFPSPLADRLSARQPACQATDHLLATDHLRQITCCPACDRGVHSYGSRLARRTAARNLCNFSLRTASGPEGSSAK